MIALVATARWIKKLFKRMMASTPSQSVDADMKTLQDETASEAPAPSIVPEEQEAAASSSYDSIFFVILFRLHSNNFDICLPGMKAPVLTRVNH